MNTVAHPAPTSATPTPAANAAQPQPFNALQAAVWSPAGRVLISGTNALVRLMLMQRARDAAAGLDTRGFVSGYRGSPLGMVDQAFWKQGDKTKAAGIEFVPAINEELAATQVLGTQRVESDPDRTVDGVFGLWYGKGPGVDRAGDAIKHGNAYGSSPHGGVLVVAGDDHGCVSSSMPHQSDQLFQAYHMPIVSPSNVEEIILFGLYGYALSRYSGNWVGLTALSEVVESTASVDLDAINAQVSLWKSEQDIHSLTGHCYPLDGVHYRWPDLPSLRIETRLQDKLAAVAAFSSVNSIDQLVLPAPQAQVGIVTAGKAHWDLMEVLRRLEITPAQLEAAGVRLIKLGLTYPVDKGRILQFAEGLSEILVVEEKGAVVEQQLMHLFYNKPQRPTLVGKRNARGEPWLADTGELRPSKLIMAVADWLQRHTASLSIPVLKLPDYVPAPMLSNASDATKRLPYFCAGCPHNTSTKVPEGSVARAGIGCHFMASWMERDTGGLIQMGGEGVDWVSHARFTKRPHVFQNLGDGTYYHSGYLAIRQAVATKANITYKVLFNDAVAMTGGQPVDGVITVDAIARQVESEGVAALAVVSDNIAPFEAMKTKFPSITTFHPREELDAVQRRLREVKGVSVLIYEQTCAAEKRRRRKKGQMVDPQRRLMIFDEVCEGCGDCGIQSNCVAVLPHETRKGRKRQIDQTACNKDYSCAKGFCPSFVSVNGGRLRRPSGAKPEVRQQWLAAAARLPDAHAQPQGAPWDLLVTGVGGTGVVTVGAVIAMAAHLEGKFASVLDFMGFAQKGGAVLSFVRVAAERSALNQVRIDTQQADAILACDSVVAATPEALQTIRKHRTRVLVNVHETPVAASVRDPDADLHTALIVDKLRHAAGEEFVETFDAQTLAQSLLGDTVTANILAMGHAWQRGLVPVGLAALQDAIRLNGVAVEANLLAFAIGRLAAANPAALQADAAPAADPLAAMDTPAFIAYASKEIANHQGLAGAQAYIHHMQQAESALRASGLPTSQTAPLHHTIARALFKLMTYKDEYEVARLYSSPAFQAQLDAQFEGDYTLDFHMSPPTFMHPADGGAPRKVTLSGRWMRPALALLAKGKFLRGTAFDPFGRTAERRLERELIERYTAQLTEVLPLLSEATLPYISQLLALPLSIRGFGHVKLRNAQAARQREAHWLHQLLPGQYPAPQHSGGVGQIKGIAVVAG